MISGLVFMSVISSPRFVFCCDFCKLPCTGSFLEQLKVSKFFGQALEATPRTIQYPAQARLFTCPVRFRGLNSLPHAFTSLSLGKFPFLAEFLRQNIILHHSKPKNDEGNFKTRVENMVHGKGPAKSYIVVWLFLDAFRQLSTTNFQDLTMKCAFYCQILFSDEKTEREKNNFAELRKLQATTELSCQINQSTVRRPHCFPSCTICSSTGLSSCLSTQETMFMNHDKKRNAIGSSFFLFFVFLFFFVMSHLWSFRSPRQTKHASLRTIFSTPALKLPCPLLFCCGAK